MKLAREWLLFGVKVKCSILMPSQIQKILWNIGNDTTNVMALKLYRIHIHNRLKSCGRMSYVLPSFSKKFGGLKFAL